MKFLVSNYSCLHNPWLRGYRPQIPVVSVVCPQLNLLNPPPEKNSWVRHWYVSHYIDTRSRHHCWRGKAISVTYSWRVSAALLIQYAMRMRCIVIRWPVWQYHIFPHYLTIDTILGWKNLLNLKYVFLFPLQLSSETFLIIRRIKRRLIKYVCWSSIKVPIITVRF